jgi:putative endonuclease
MKPHPEGKAAEKAAARFLKRLGLKVVRRNFDTPFGEIDIVAVDGETLVFAEVRSRAADSPVRPEDTVNRTKQRRLRRAAELYLKKHGLLDTAPFRFDVLALTANADGDGWQIDHFIDAF